MNAYSIFHVGPISGLATFSDKYIATAGYDNQLILWCAQTNKALACGRHDHLVNQCDFSPDGTLLVSSSSDYTARVWSVPDMRLIGVISVHADDVSKAAFSPDGQQIATSSFDGTLSVHDLHGVFKKRLVGHTGLIENFDWGKDNRTLQSCGMDGTIRTWDTLTGECRAVRSIDGVDIDTLVTLTDGTILAGNSDGSIASIDPYDNVTFFDAHTTAIKLLFADDAERRLVSLGYDNRVHIWDLNKGSLEAKIKTSTFPRCIWARSASFLTENVIAFATFGTTYATWDLASDVWDTDRVGPIPGVNAVFAGSDGIYSVGDAGVLEKSGAEIANLGTLCNFVVEDNGQIFAGGQAGIVFDALTATELYRHNSPLNCAVIVKSAAATFLAVGTYSGHVIYLNVKDPAETKVVKVHSGAIKGIACQNGIIATGTSDGEIKYTDVDTLEVTSEIGSAHDGIVNDLCVYESGFATVSRDLTLRLWRNGVSSPDVFKSSHRHSIKCVASSSRGDLIASGSYGGTIQVFDVNRKNWTGKPVRPTLSGISSLTWDEATQAFIAGSYDGRLYSVHP
ncbi:WD40 repeat domain-containing protein [Flexibacterium corallicola]|uniref:WD40 repeat domain-containing protein n=1 Tax=Flexibacterium corallicola TaxID=3037259 RepID=UPI00286F195F|nr:WD40 repeat domain-containing protein [Pseudovibrio sp. M1P-2-3]